MLSVLIILLINIGTLNVLNGYINCLCNCNIKYNYYKNGIKYKHINYNTITKLNSINNNNTLLINVSNYDIDNVNKSKIICNIVYNNTNNFINKNDNKWNIINSLINYNNINILHNWINNDYIKYKNNINIIGNNNNYNNNNIKWIWNYNNICCWQIYINKQYESISKLIQYKTNKNQNKTKY